MTKEELKQEAEKYVKQNYCEICVMADDCKCGCIDCFTVQAYLASAEPREKQIADLEDKLANAGYQLEGRDNEIKELEVQIEKMKEIVSDMYVMFCDKCENRNCAFCSVKEKWQLIKEIKEK